MKNIKSNILKICVFATGLSGIVAEYVLATLATYFIGNSMIQWALIVSIMMFAMGLGSRLSRFIKHDLLMSFIGIEFLLSILVGYSALITYTTVAYSNFISLVIYSLSIMVGLLIGMEIPLVIRMNKEFQSLRLNISGVMEHDYYGSLVGGFFFSFVGMPYLGMTYTPFVLALVNFGVALALIAITAKVLTKEKQRTIFIIGSTVAVLLISGFWIAEPIMFYGEQKKYKDKVIYQEQSRYQKIVLTEWKGDYWLYLNGNLQTSSYDEALYHEPLVHPALQFVKKAENVLIIGGGDGCAARELLKYKNLKKIRLVDLDPAMIVFAKTNPVMQKLNQGALSDSRVEIFTQDGFTFLEKDTLIYDAIIIDLPDPRSVDLSRLYSVEFYNICKYHLRNHGVLITQATSPYYAATSYKCIYKTITASGMYAVPMHNQILTMGEWGWIIANKKYEPKKFKEILQSLEFDNVATKWLNKEAMMQITSFGKDYYNITDDTIMVNSMNEPILYRYYLRSNWDTY